jgi:hypothetical protein
MTTNLPTDNPFLNYIPKTGDLILFFPSLFKLNILRTTIMLLTCSNCDHVAIIYKNVPEMILTSRLKTRRSVSDTYILEFDNPQGLQIYAYENYVDNEGNYAYKSLNKSLDEPAIKNKLDSYLYEIYQRPFASNLNLFEALFRLNQKDNTSKIFCGQFVTELLQKAGVVSSNVLSNNIIPKDYYNNKVLLINSYEYTQEEFMTLY